MSDKQQPTQETKQMIDDDKVQKESKEILNPFAPDSLRLSSDFDAKLGVKKALLTVPVRKPAKEWWIQTHPDESYRLPTAIIELKEAREIYLVAPGLWPQLAGESTFGAKMLITAINRQNVPFIWPIRMPGSDGRIDHWSRSALEGADIARKGWVRVQANMALGAYDVFETEAVFPEPEWPEQTFQELLEIAFKDRFIQDPNHPVLKQLRGEK